MYSKSRIAKHASPSACSFGMGSFRRGLELLNLSYEPTRELYQEFQRGICQTMGGEYPGTRSPSSNPIRIGQAGAHRDRRPDRGCRHARACLRHRQTPPRRNCCQPTGRSACRTTVHRTVHRVSSCARAIPRTSRIGMSRQAWHLGDYAEPENLRRRTLELSGACWFRAEEPW